MFVCFFSVVVEIRAKRHLSSPYSLPHEWSFLQIHPFLENVLQNTLIFISIQQGPSALADINLNARLI